MKKVYQTIKFKRYILMRQKKVLKKLNTKYTQFKKCKKCNHTDKPQNINVIDFPEILSLQSPYDSDCFAFIKNLRTYIMHSNERFAINHTKIAQIDIDALLVVVAEIQRCTTVRQTTLKYNKKFAPKNNTAIAMLKLIGYWEHFNINANHQIKLIDRLYLKIAHDTKANYEQYLKIRKFFNDNLKFLKNQLKLCAAFDEAITEAIANAVEHAYVRTQDIQTIQSSWWICGYYDCKVKELVFACFDQGIGLKNAISHNDDRKIQKWFSAINIKSQSDANIIKMLVNNKLPKYNNRDRGYGFGRFSGLRNYYKQSSLEIYSCHGYYGDKYENGTIVSNTLNDNKVNKIDGTLVIWRINLEEIDNGNI